MTWNLPTTLENIPDNSQEQQQPQQVPQRRERASNFLHLSHKLFQHVIQQKNSGVPIQDIENFLQDRNAVKSFFESRGYKFQPRSKSYLRLVNTQLNNSGSDSSGYRDEVNSDVQYVPTRADANCNHNYDREEEDGRYRPDNRVDAGSGAKSDNTELLTGLQWLRHRISANLSKLAVLTKHLLVFAIILVIGHFGISYMLDVNPLKLFPNIMERRCLIPAHPIIMEMTRPIADCKFCQAEQDSGSKNSKWNAVIEMWDLPSKEEFAEVAYLSKPVIIRNGGRNEGIPMEFDFQKLKDIFQSEPGGIDAVSEECQFLPFRSPFTTLREAFDTIQEDSGWNEPWYIGWSNCHPGVATKLRKIFPRPKFLPDESSSSAIDWIFIGSPGLGASMHIDYVKRPSWQAQLSGVKRWLLRPPPECESVCPESLTFTINPGDLLFLETNTWYHQTFIEGDKFSISIGSEYD